jgi:hypothetical protein
VRVEPSALDAAAEGLAALMLSGQSSDESIAAELRRHGIAREPSAIAEVLRAARRRVREVE